MDPKKMKKNNKGICEDYQQSYHRSLLQSFIDRSRTPEISIKKIFNWNFGQNSSAEKHVISLQAGKQIISILIYINDFDGITSIVPEKIKFWDGTIIVPEKLSAKSICRHASVHFDFVLKIVQSAMISLQISAMRRSLHIM